MKKVESIEEFLSLDYEVKVTPYESADDHGFVITCPEIKEIEVFGETIEDAFEELKEAKIAIYNMKQELGEPLQYPSRHYSFEAKPSGRLTVRLPIDLHEEVISYSKENSISLNVSIIQLLTKGLQQKGYENLSHKLDNIGKLVKTEPLISLNYQNVNRKEWRKLPLSDINESEENDTSMLDEFSFISVQN